MVDLAKQAFSTNNFHLAVEIYEREINEHGPSVDLFLGIADSFAKIGQFGKAFESYSRASRLGSISPEKLKHLVTSLINCVKTEKASCQMLKQSNPCLFTCLICRGLFNDPVTIPCGHTYCRKCLEKDQTKTCKNCGIVHYCMNISRIKTNYLLSRVVEQWFPSECRAAGLKSEGNNFMERQKFDRAIALYSEAIDLGKISESHVRIFGMHVYLFHNSKPEVYMRILVSAYWLLPSVSYQLLSDVSKYSRSRLTS